MREASRHVRHYAEPEAVFTLCGEKIIPRDVHWSWPECASCVREVKRFFGEEGVEAVNVMWTGKLKAREDETLRMMEEMLHE